MSHITPIQVSMLVVILVLIALFEALDYYFYRQLFRKQHRPKPLLVAHWSLHTLTITGIIALLFLFGQQNAPTTQQWISTISILFLSQLWGKLLFLLGSLPRVWMKRPKRKKQFLYLGLFLLSAVWIGMSLSVWNAFHPKVRTVEIKINNLPHSFDGYTIAFLSDLHLGLFGTNHKAIREAVRITNELQPDLILFGGDLVSLSSDEALPYTDLLATLYAPDGKFAVRGNHDYGIYNRSNPNLKQEQTRFTEINRAMGISLLDNQSALIAKGNDSLYIIGTEYFNPERNFPDGLGKASEGISDKHPRILLTHNPNHYAASVLGKTTIDLTLAGHTHAMQFVINLFGFRFSPSSLLFKHWGGLYENGHQKLYVNEGLGSSLYSIRWGTPSEITHIVLRKDVN